MVFSACTLAQHGFVAFSINYRLVSKGGGFPADVQDVKDAIAFLAAQASQWRIDASKLVTLGESAGGHLALMAAYTPNRGRFASPHHLYSTARVAAVISFYGYTNLMKLQYRRTVQRYLGGSIRRVGSAVYRDASPISYVRTAVPTLLVQGTKDHSLPLSQSVELEHLLRQRGTPTNLVLLTGASHGFMDSAGYPREAAFAAVFSFVLVRVVHNAALER
jgi:acetyl esterase/lipase